ncbi:hypothetical protein MTsDn1_17980 [Alteromonas sp. MTD1]|uniref:hypothetical protein n=1 Tax=Alteromonas sp. MTD1 TaxID=3057962 RepID=UPI0036F222F7
MARLSQRAMNNVVIIAMLIMIALFNLESFTSSPEAPAQRMLLPQDAYVLKIEHDGNALERTGQQWRQRSNNKVLGITPDRQFSEWQRAILVPTNEVPEDVVSQQPLIVVVWVAGNTNGLVYAFYPSATMTVVNVDNNWYTLSNAKLENLLPWNT